MNKGIIKNESLIQEVASDSDYLKSSESVSTLQEKIKASRKPSMLGVVGPFGIGKSSLIEQLKVKIGNNDTTWIMFDAWQFPERKELWEGLVLETARQIGKLDKIKKVIEGKSNKDKELAVSTIGSGIDIAANIATKGTWTLIKSVVELISGAGKHFLDESPVRRVFEIQELFKDLIEGVKTPKLIFILEDVDRSGQDGLFFIETFKQFLQNNKLNKEIDVIITISDKHFHESIDTYLKCLDFVEFLQKRDSVDFQDFLKDALDLPNENDYVKLNNFFKYLYITDTSVNMRKVKIILRQANVDFIDLYNQGYSPSPIVSIGLAAAKFMRSGNSDSESLFDYFLRQNMVTTNNAVNRLLMNSSKRLENNVLISMPHSPTVLAKTKEILFSKRDLKTNTGEYPSEPYYEMYDNEKMYIPDFYFKNL